MELITIRWVSPLLSFGCWGQAWGAAWGAVPLDRGGRPRPPLSRLARGQADGEGARPTTLAGSRLAESKGYPLRTILLNQPQAQSQTAAYETHPVEPSRSTPLAEVRHGCGGLSDFSTSGRDKYLCLQ